MYAVAVHAALAMGEPVDARGLPRGELVVFFWSCSTFRSEAATDRGKYEKTPSRNKGKSGAAVVDKVAKCAPNCGVERLRD